MTKLLPCKICGLDARYISLSSTGAKTIHMVQCINSCRGEITRWYSAQKYAANAWNEHAKVRK